MGLDSVELVMRIEEEFGIDLPDAELSSIRTVGDLYRLVMTKMQTGPSTRISRAFYSLRRAMMACLGLPRNAIHPITKLAPLLPKPTRIAAWKSLAEVSQLEFPKLRHPRWARDTIRVLTAAAAIAFFAFMVSWTHPWGLLWLPLLGVTAVVAFVVFSGVYAATSFLARELPVRKVGELAEVLLGMNLMRFDADSKITQPLSTQDIWQRLVYIFCDQTALNWEEITPESRIAEDLGID
ncbi:phosphopantetheine-binding protein [Acidicapsa ligni]|uniref:phosphopantetheine-binding protein n=1 Tax=Acidicapsa ligni TaxID=542300 RepID=UPI0021DFFCE8|nr:phosphopantetheine-binding protein [Acidicapsa ligni]